MSELHGTAVEWQGMSYLFIGPSGSGKSDLALQMIGAGGKLIADDYVEINLRDGQLVARAIEQSKGLLEVRGMGILNMPYHLEHPLHLVVKLQMGERLPEKDCFVLGGVELPIFYLSATSPSALERLKIMGKLIHGSIKRAC